MRFALLLSLFSFLFLSPEKALADTSFQDVFEKHNVIMLLIDPKTGEIVDANAAASRFYKYTRSDLRRMSIQQINLMSADQVAKERQLAMNEGRNYFIFKHALGNGEIKTVEVHSVPYFFEGRELLFSIIRDISQERKLQSSLWHYQSQLEEIVESQTETIEHKARQSVMLVASIAGILFIFLIYLFYLLKKRHQDEKQIRLASSVFNNATEAVLVTDQYNVIQTVNKAFCTITGYSEQEVVGQKPSILKSGRHSNEFYKEMYQRLNAHGSWEGEIWNKRRNGEIYPERLTITILKDKNGFREGFVGIFHDITKRKETEEKIIKQANYDSLTGLANRHLFLNRIERAITRAERNETKVALLFIDLDRFKHVNETFGHFYGDELLIEAAQRLKQMTRKSDTCARLGSDEFAVLLPDITDESHIEEIVEKLLDKLSEPYHLDEHVAYVSGSIGVTLYSEDGQTAEDLLRNADSAMYRAKDKGRNGFQFFTQEMEKQSLIRREIESALHLALENNEFIVNYQPILRLSDEKITNCEALIRWNSPLKGMVSPADFIPLAEDNGLIVAIGEWVLWEACKEAASWHENNPESPAVAVNMSIRQFQRVNVPALVSDVLEETGLPVEKLTLEITENLLIEDDKTIMEQLTALNDMGIRLAIDDFGTGYSSLSYLKKFPISTVKIDRSFINDITTNPEDAALVRGIISLTQDLNLRVVAEGIETEEQAKMLKAKNCCFAQGFLYSKPLSAVDFRGLLKK